MHAAPWSGRHPRNSQPAPLSPLAMSSTQRTAITAVLPGIPLTPMALSLPAQSSQNSSASKPKCRSISISSVELKISHPSPSAPSSPLDRLTTSGELFIKPTKVYCSQPTTVWLIEMIPSQSLVLLQPQTQKINSHCCSTQLEIQPSRFLVMTTASSKPLAAAPNSADLPMTLHQ